MLRTGPAARATPAGVGAARSGGRLPPRPLIYACGEHGSGPELLSCGGLGETCQRASFIAWHPPHPGSGLPPWQSGRGGPHVPGGPRSTGRRRIWGRTGTWDLQKETQLSFRQGGGGPCTYANFLIYEMSGHLDLLRDAPDGEYSQVGVSVGRGVPLELHVRPGLLIYAFDVLTPCGQADTRHKGKRQLRQSPTFWSLRPRRGGQGRAGPAALAWEWRSALALL